jgi:hypothetical protein
VGARLSIAVKLKSIVVDDVLKLLAGRLRRTAGAAVSTVKFLVALVPALLALSLQETVQVW